MTIKLRLLTTADVHDLHPRLRVEDQEECIVLGSNPREALLMGAFDNVFSGVSRGRAYAIISDKNGLIGAIGFTSTGYLWALSVKFALGDLRELYKRTPELHARLLKEARENGVFQESPYMEPYFHNVIHARNSTSMKWLAKCGDFLVFQENPIDVGGETFYPFRSKVPSEKIPACVYH